MANLTPPINAMGVFELKAPYTVEPGASYICEAIDGFEALDFKGVDIYTVYYKAKGLSEDIYRSDRRNGINIITLLSEGNSPIYVPSSYIKSFPNTAAVPYSHVFATFDLGTLPDGLSIDSTLNHASTVLNGDLGVQAKHKLHLMPLTGVVDFAKHTQLEKVRLSTIALQDNPLTQLKAALDENRKLRERVGLLEAALVRQV